MWLLSEDDPDTGVDETVVATGYTALLEAANAETPAEGAAEELANAGLLVAVDITPPAVEFTGASPKDGATALAGWVLHVTDGGSGLASDPIDASIEVRDGDGTEDVDEADDATSPEAGEFAVIANTPNTRFTTTVNTPAVGYYTFSATATDKAGNETASGSRVALNDDETPRPIRLFVAPGADDSTYDKTLLANDNLSIAGYQVNLPLPSGGIPGNDLDSPEIMLGAETVDAYNASSLTDDLLVRGPVEFPYLALQSAATATPAAIASIKAYVSDQVGVAVSDPATEGIVAPETDDIPAVTGFRSGGAFTVTATDGTDGTTDDPNTTIEDGDNTVEITATAQMEDESTDFPFSRVDFYAEATTDDGDNGTFSELRLIATVSGLSATVKTTTDPDGRDWTYATEVDADAYYAAVDGDEEYTGNVVAFGVSTAKGGSVAVVAVSATLTLEERE